MLAILVNGHGNPHVPGGYRDSHPAGVVVGEVAILREFDTVMRGGVGNVQFPVMFDANTKWPNTPVLDFHTLPFGIGGLREN